MSSDRLHDAAQKIRDTAERHAAARRGDSQDYEWQEARQALMLLGFAREDVAVAVADWLDTEAEGVWGGWWDATQQALDLADAILGPVTTPA
jgi:Holliday junction resolvasome RuvABC DNA-binding subunit